MSGTPVKSLFFSYRSLSPGIPRIRLVRLLPLKGVDDQTPQSSEVVSCELFHVSLENVPEYIALSYTWGINYEKHSIDLNGVPFQASANLEIMLRHLRKQGDPMILWVDALCINQEDEVEKTEQVQQMQLIYSKSTSVIAWCGPSAEGSDDAMEWIANFGTRAFELGIGNRPELQLLNLLNNYFVPDRQFTEDKLDVFLRELIQSLAPPDSAPNKTADALAKFFGRPYWTRVWVVQELTKGPVLHLQCGNKAVSEEALHHASRLLRNYTRFKSLDKGDNRLEIDPSNSINLLKGRRTKGILPLIYLLRIFRYMDSTDPRDKVFALVGISSDSEKLGIDIDYRKSYKEVYTSSARAFIQHGIFDVLSLVSHPRSVEGLPSWVPDWSNQLRHKPLQQRAQNRSLATVEVVTQPHFSASGDIKQPSLSMPQAPNLWDAPLSLSCIVIGKVLRAGAAWRYHGETNWLTNLFDLSQEVQGYYRDTEAQLRATLRTAVADQDIRRATQKPRLSREQVDMFYKVLEGQELGNVNKKFLMSNGLSNYSLQLGTIAEGRCPILVSSGAIGLAPDCTHEGDLIAVVLGAPVPFVFRKEAQNNAMEFIGEAYVHGIMDGEATAISEKEILMIR